MTNFENDFSGLFNDGQDASERMLAFGVRINTLADQLDTVGIVVPLDDEAKEQVLVRESTVLVAPRYRKSVPGVEIIDPVSGRPFGTLASTAHHEQRVFTRTSIVAGNIHYQPPGEWFSIKADSTAFLDPRTIELYKAPFRTAVQLLGRVMLRQEVPTES